MPAPPDVDALTDQVVRSFYDPGSIARGEAYADEGRVRLLGGGPGQLNAVCRGSGRNSYVVHIRWTIVDGRVDLHDDCSCPMGDGCKHCVATIVTARTDTALSRPTIPARPAPNWRHALAGLEDDDDIVRADDTDLALQVSVRQPRTDRYAASDERQLMVRPMRRGKNGKWIKTGASWSDIASPYARPGAAVDPLQRAALRALMASARIEYYSNNQTVPFNQFGPDLWYQLERAVEVGVQLIGEHPTTKVELSAVPARATIDLTADDTGAVHLTDRVHPRRPAPAPRRRHRPVGRAGARPVDRRP